MLDGRRFAAGLLRLAAAIAARTPWRLLPYVGALVGFIAGSVVRVRRRHVEDAMRAAGLLRPAAAARAMYRALGTSLFEFLHMAGSHRGAPAAERVRLDDGSAATWRRLLAARRGVVVAFAHTGNWDLAACAVARDVELLVVTKHLHVRALDDFWQRVRAERGVLLSDATGALVRARAVLGRGGAVAMMIDQVPAERRHAVEVSFLGRTALVDRAPAALAAVAGAPLVVAAARRSASGEHVLSILGVLDPPRRPSVRWVVGAAATATRRLEAFVLEHPSQWLWLHRRWKRLDPAPCEATLAPQ